MSHTKTCELEGTMLLDEEEHQAVLFDIDGNEVWVPRSVLYGYEAGELTVAEWWAKERELI